MPNQLALELSPYLLQHADNPVDWMPWGPEALERAHKEDKPIFLSMGYATCHWCHVMAHESFEDAEVARVLNEHFISIKVDREERPDLDSVFMTVCQVLDRQRRLAHHLVPHPRCKAVLRRDLLSQAAHGGQAGVFAHGAGDRAGYGGRSPPS